MSVALEVEVVPTGTVGAEMRGVDLAAVTEAQVDAIKQAWYRHDVLVFRDQEMTDDDLLSFSTHFGTLDPPPNQGAGRKSPPGYPDIYVGSNVRASPQSSAWCDAAVRLGAYCCLEVIHMAPWQAIA